MSINETRDHRSRLLLYPLVGALVIVFVPVAIALASSSGSNATPSKGPVPSSAVYGGNIDKNLVPEFIPALDQRGNQVGYVAKDLAIPGPSAGPNDTPIPVYASDLKTQVGHMVNGIGFVPLGRSVDSTPSLVPTAIPESP